MDEPNPKNRLKIIGINLVMLAFLFGLVSFNKEILRPAFSQRAFAGFLTGIFPNFIAAFLISLAIGNAVLNKQPKNNRIFIYGGAAMVFVLLGFEEIYPLWGASTTYDPFDILASGLGAVLSVITIELMLRKRR